MLNKVPVVGVIALPFYNQIVCTLFPPAHEPLAQWSVKLQADMQFSARQGGGAYMNRTTPLPLTGGVPQPLTRLKDCLIAAECTYLDMLFRPLKRWLGDG